MTTSLCFWVISVLYLPCIDISSALGKTPIKSGIILVVVSSLRTGGLGCNPPYEKAFNGEAPLKKLSPSSLSNWEMIGPIYNLSVDCLSLLKIKSQTTSFTLGIADKYFGNKGNAQPNSSVVFPSSPPTDGAPLTLTLIRPKPLKNTYYSPFKRFNIILLALSKRFSISTNLSKS